MRENNLMALAILGVIIGASGLGFGVYSTMQLQTGAIVGEDGDDGDAGQKGENAPGSFMVGILDPDEGESVSGNITIKALVVGSDEYTVKVLINGSLNATYIPFVWNSSRVADGWWNLTVIVTDLKTNEVVTDSALILVENQRLFKGGIWGHAVRNMDYSPFNKPNEWQIEVRQIQVNNSDYFYMSRSDTRFHLIVSGWYRFNIIVAFTQLDDPDLYLAARLNGGGYINAWYKRDVDLVTGNVQCHTTFYVYSDGDDYYELQVYCPNPSSDFDLTSQVLENQIVLEYVHQ